MNKFFIYQKEEFLTQNQCEIIFKLHGNQNFQKHGALRGLSFSSFDFFLKNGVDQFLSEIDNIFNFSNKLYKEIDHVRYKFGLNHNLVISNLWLNVQKKGSILLPHTHENSVISGAIYLMVDEISNKLKFTHNNEETIISPKIGSLILFPSWLEHQGETPNRSIERVVLSFNTIY